MGIKRSIDDTVRPTATKSPKNRNLIFLEKMKLSTIFAILTVSDAQKKGGKKVVTHETSATRLKNLIDFVWDKWYKNCHNNPNGDKARNRYKKLVDRCLKNYKTCGTDPNAGRRRRDALEDICVDENGDNACIRLNKDNREKAVKQLGNLLEKWGETYMSECTRGLTTEKIAEKAENWRQKLENKKCHQGTKWIMNPYVPSE